MAAQFTLPAWIDALSEEYAIKLLLYQATGGTVPSGGGSTVAISQATPGTTNGVAVKNLKGEAGNTNETGTTARTGGDWGALHCLTDTVIASYTDALETGGDSLAGVTLPAGTILYGQFSAFTLTSGAVRAYNRN